MHKLFTFVPDSPGEGYALRLFGASLDVCYDYALQEEFQFYRIEYTENSMTMIIFETEVNL